MLYRPLASHLSRLHAQRRTAAVNPRQSIGGLRMYRYQADISRNHVARAVASRIVFSMSSPLCQEAGLSGGKAATKDSPEGVVTS